VNETSIVHEPNAGQNPVKHVLDGRRLRDSFVVHDGSKVAICSGHNQEARPIVFNEFPSLLHGGLKKQVRVAVTFDRLDDAIMPSVEQWAVEQQALSTLDFTLKLGCILHEF
jgi:hypothetical protein